MDSLGQILTFYSYKGGVGRSMGLANVAALLSKWRRKVLIIDWDLEAPGIESYFESYAPISNIRKERPGVIDLVHSIRSGDAIDWRDCLISVPLKSRKTFESAEELKIISAGRDDGQYVSRVQNTDWGEMFRSRDLGIHLETLRNEWKDTFDFILIDSRTGITDIGGVCTIHLPDVLVAWFTTNETSVRGIKHVADQARAQQNDLPFDRNPLFVLPVPSRDESRSEVKRAAYWQERFAQQFGSFYREWLPKNVEPSNVVERLRIPYIPYWSTEEKLPVVEEGTSDPSGIGQAYDLLSRLIFFNLDWQRIDSNPEQSLEYLARAAEIDVNRFGPELADTFFDEALRFWKEELKEEATDATRKALEIWEKLTITDLSSYGLKLARAKKLLSELLQDTDEQEAMSQARDAIDAYRNLYELDPNTFRDEVATSLTELSNRFHEKEPEVAIEALSQAIDIQRFIARANPRSEVELARALYDLANWYIEEKEFSLASTTIQEAISIYRRLTETDSERFEPDLADSLTTLSECLLEAGDVDRALATGYEAVEIYKILAQRSPRRHESGLVKTFNALLDILSRADLNATDRALSSINDAVTEFRRLAQKDPTRYEPDLAKALNMLPEQLSASDRIEEALASQEEAIEIFRRLRARNPARYESDLAQSLLSLSKLRYKTGDSSTARRIASEATEIFERLSKKAPSRYEEDLKEALELASRNP